MDETTNNNNQEGGAGTWAWVVTGAVIVVALAGFYYWPHGRSNLPPTNTPEQPAQNDESVQPLATSDSVSDIETDLKNTNVDNVDKETADILSELNAN